MDEDAVAWGRAEADACGRVERPARAIVEREIELRSITDSALRLFANTLFVRERTGHTTDATLRYRIAWV